MDQATSQDQQLVLDEKADLDMKLSKLKAFIDLSSIFGALPVDERTRLVTQYRVMTQYSFILGQRIEAF